MDFMKAGEKVFFYWEKENRKIKLQNEDIRWNQDFLSTWSDDTMIPVRKVK